MMAETAAGVPPEPFVMDGEREALAPLLALRPLIWRRAAAAKDFDTGLYLLGAALDTLRWRAQVDSEDAMARRRPTPTSGAPLARVRAS